MVSTSILGILRTSEINRNKIMDVINNISTILPIANSHMVNFITHNLFEKLIPKPLQDEVMALEATELNNIVFNSFTHWPIVDNNLERLPNLAEFLQNANQLSLKRCDDCISFSQLYDNMSSNSTMKSSLHIVKNLMSTKKSHEVEIMSGIIAAMVKSKNCTHIVDVGGGKGYLSSVLSLKHNLKVLSIDSSSTTSEGAAKQMPKVEKLWKSQVKKSINSIEENSGDQNIKVTHKSSELCKLATLFIKDDTDVVGLVRDNFCGEDVGAVALVGLHTCGNLATSALRLFTNRPDQVKCLVNVGCCYHLITEQFAENPQWLEDREQAYGFPMSACLREMEFALGRNARMLAAQPPDRISQQGTVQTEMLFYRALLEVYLEKKFVSANAMVQFRVGKIAKKCLSFSDYVHKSIKRLGLDIQVDEGELEELVVSHKEDRRRLHAFFLLRLALAPAIEAAVLLDRLLYLKEQGIKDVFLTQLFDPVVSPRCYAIIAFNQ